MTLFEETLQNFLKTPEKERKAYLDWLSSLDWNSPSVPEWRYHWRIGSRFDEPNPHSTQDLIYTEKDPNGSFFLVCQFI